MLGRRLVSVQDNQTALLLSTFGWYILTSMEEGVDDEMKRPSTNHVLLLAVQMSLDSYFTLPNVIFCSSNCLHKRFKRALLFQLRDYTVALLMSRPWSNTAYLAIEV
jgi:hypothetical protein